MEVVIFDESGVVTELEKGRRLHQKQELKKRVFKYKNKYSRHKIKDKNQDHENCPYKRRKLSQKYNGNVENNTLSEEDGKKGSEDFEDGELTTSSMSTSSDNESISEGGNCELAIYKVGGKFQDIAKKYPPSLRIIVQETNLEGLKVGNLSMITFKGGTLGREGNHDVVIPDVNVSKFHLKFIYDTKDSMYKCMDLGSRNGTILNGSFMSTSKTESIIYDLVHGSILQISHTKLLCHIHEGNSTCGLCEPGLLIERQQQETSPGPALSHKEQLKKIRRKYGLENEKFVAGKEDTGIRNIMVREMTTSYTKNNKTPYLDRAATRRLKFGSSSDKEKTQIASLDTEISCNNKGFKMLSKLGWNKGEPLGKLPDTGSLLEPIHIRSNAGHKGLGCSDPTAGLTLSSSDKKKLELIRKTKQRYEAADGFSHLYDNN